jgi:hypothetical protein
MKEYIVVPPVVLSRAPALKHLVSRSLEFAKTLKPKKKKMR